MKSSSRRKLFYYIGVLLCCSISQCSGSKTIRTSARSIAVRAGAAQFKESIEEIDHATRRDRRLADAANTQEDNFDEDYEVYQGVVGRPGIDFPVLVGIPITNFNCRRMGNGYFADLETDCQVFHICDSGRKISFLCPNGTIFKQNELICDWWFKVDCSQSPRQYAESSELLQRHRTRDRPVKLSTTILYERDTTTKSSQRLEKQQPPVQHQGRSRGRPTQATPSPTTRKIVELPVEEDFDFVDVNTVTARSTTRRPSTTFARSTVRSRQVEDESSVTENEQIDYSTETQEVAESGSFVQPNGGYALNRPNDEEDNRKFNKNTRKDERIVIVVEDDSVEVPAPVSKVNSDVDTSSTTPSTTTTTTAAPTTTRRTTTTTTTKTAAPSTTTTTRRPAKTTTVGATTFSRRGTAKFRANSVQPEFSLTTSTPSFDNENSYTTAKRLGTTKSNVSPFYTPTVPTIVNRNNIVNEVSSTIPTPVQLSTTESTPVEHAIEMIKTLKTLESIDDDILPPFDTPFETPFETPFNTPFETPKQSETQSRVGLNIPPSSGPDTLNSLAMYFATAVDSLVKSNSTEPTPSANSTAEAIVDSGLLSSKTIAKYGQLFGKEGNVSDELPQLPEIINVNTEKTIASRVSAIEDHTEDLLDLKTEFSTNSLFSSSTPQVRELAQVFTHALSAYLHDPEEFRQILTGIRPTEPPTLLDDDEILSNRIGRTDVYGNPTVSTNGAAYLPTRATPPATTDVPATSDDFEVLDFSDVTVSTNYRKDTTESGINFKLTTEKNESTSNEVTTANNLDDISTEAGLTSTVYPIKEKAAFNINADKTPASDLITKDLTNDFTTTTDSISTETNNPIAMEVNRILLDATAFPYFGGEDDKTEIGNYFPEDIEENNRTLYKPYGNDVKVNSTPISDEKLFTNTQSIPLRWSGEESTTTGSTSSATSPTTVANLISGLLPPNEVKLSSIEKVSLNADVEDSTVADEEQLQRAHSQSIVTGVNELNERKSHKIDSIQSENLVIKVETSSGNPIASRILPIRGHYITQKYPAQLIEDVTTQSIQSPSTTEATPTTTDASSSESTTYLDSTKYSPNPWQSLAYTVFLDPLTINDGLMEDLRATTTETSIITSTHVEHLNSAEATTKGAVYSLHNEILKLAESAAPTSSTITTESSTKITAEDAALHTERRGKTFPTTSFPSSRFSSDDTTINDEQLQSIDEPMEIMKERANEIFGNLNETQANSLMNVMKTADSNKSVRRLILLLIQTCDDDYNKTVEESRNALLNALIGMDHTFEGTPEIKVINTRRAAKNSEPINPIVASSTTDAVSTTSNQPSTQTTTTSQPTTETTARSNSEESSTVNTEFRIDLSDENDFYSTSTTQQNSQEVTTTNQPTTNQPTTNIAINVETTTEAGTSTTVLDESREESTTVISTTGAPTITTTTASTTTEQSTTTVTEEITTMRSRKRTGKSLDSSLGIADLQSTDGDSKHSDERALELLKSLYSLASKWGKR